MPQMFAINLQMLAVLAQHYQKCMKLAWSLGFDLSVEGGLLD